MEGVTDVQKRRNHDSRKEGEEASRGARSVAGRCEREVRRKAMGPRWKSMTSRRETILS